MRRIEWLARSVLGVALSGLIGCEVSDEPASNAATEVENSSAVQKIVRGKLRFVNGHQNGLAQAARQGKPMLLFFTAHWCHFCHQMADEAFTDDQVVQLSERFVCVLIDADAASEVCRRYQVRNYPTIQFVGPQGTALNRVTGKRPGHVLVREMHSALQAVARTASIDSPRQ